MANRPLRIEPLDGQESVWDYPRPPALERVRRRIRVVVAGETIADGLNAIRVLETSHPPTYYLPPDAVRLDLLEASTRNSSCEWKGAARYFSINVGDVIASDAAWSYDAPAEGYSEIQGWFALHPRRVDEAWVDGRRALAQPGLFYGGWITSDIVGPFKGGPGTDGW